MAMARLQQKTDWAGDRIGMSRCVRSCILTVPEVTDHEFGDKGHEIAAWPFDGPAADSWAGSGDGIPKSQRTAFLARLRLAPVARSDRSFRKRQSKSGREWDR